MADESDSADFELRDKESGAVIEHQAQAQESQRRGAVIEHQAQAQESQRRGAVIEHQAQAQENQRRGAAIECQTRARFNIMDEVSADIEHQTRAPQHRPHTSAVSKYQIQARRNSSNSSKEFQDNSSSSSDESVILWPRNGKFRQRQPRRDSSCPRHAPLPEHALKNQNTGSQGLENHSRKSQTRSLCSTRRSSQRKSQISYKSKSQLGRISQAVSETHCERAGEKRRCPSSSPDRDPPRKTKRSRQCHSPPGVRSRNCETNTNFNCNDSSTESVLDKLLNIIKNVKHQSSSKLSLNNVIPEFDPMSKDQTILMWLTKVEECADIYEWNERETIHFALPKLTGVARTWYQGLSTVLYSWGEWKKKLIENFPFRDDYAELLLRMLAKKAKYGESLERYFYDKINYLNRCGIKGHKAVDCILNGVEDRTVRVGAQAAQFREPEQVLRYFKTIRAASSRDTGERGERQRQDRNTTGAALRRSELKMFMCHNCTQEGHKSTQCQQPSATCTTCGKLGHISRFCRHNKEQPQDSK